MELLALISWCIYTKCDISTLSTHYPSREYIFSIRIISNSNMHHLDVRNLIDRNIRITFLGENRHKWESNKYIGRTQTIECWHSWCRQWYTNTQENSLNNFIKIKIYCLCTLRCKRDVTYYANDQRTDKLTTRTSNRRINWLWV